MVQFKLVTSNDIDALVQAALSAFAAEARKYGHYPPGLDSPDRHKKAMQEGIYYKILDNTQIIGGIIITNLGQRHYKLDTIFIAEAYQNQGIGAEAIRFIEQTIPAKSWTLKTPASSQQNHHFYEKLGYKKVRIAGPEEYPDDPNTISFFVYEKQMKP